MWENFSSFILRKRYEIMAILLCLTLFFGYKAKDVRMSYEMAQVLPETDSTLIDFEEFQSLFGQDGSIMVIGIKDSKLYEIENFRGWMGPVGSFERDRRNRQCGFNGNGLWLE